MSGDSEKEKKRFVLTPSLEHLVLVKIATLLVSESNAPYIFVREKICGPPQSIKYKDYTRSVFESVEYDVMRSVGKLLLPEKLKDKICSLFRPIEVQVVYWKQCPTNYLERMFLQNFRNVSWTSLGTIDKRKTCEAVVKIQALDMSSRYELACIYCLEDDIPVLWDQMSETERNEIVFDSEESIEMRKSFCSSGGLFYFWSCVRKGEEFRLKDMTENYPLYTPHEYMFEYAAVRGNKAAVEYFLKKLTPEEKTHSLLKAATHVCSLCDYYYRYDLPYCYYGEILWFLLSQIDEEEYRGVIRQNYEVLLNILDWPCQFFFWDVADLLWADIDGELVDILLRDVLLKIQLCYDYNNYRELLEELCRRCLPEHKKYIIGLQWTCDSVLAKLLELGDEKNMKMILKDATTEEINKLIFDHSDKCVCHWIFDYYCDWLSEEHDYMDATRLYRDFVCEYISNKDEIEKFKDGIKNHVFSLRKNPSELQTRILSHYLEDFPQNSNKRSVEDVSFSKSKKLKSCP